MATPYMRMKIISGTVEAIFDQLECSFFAKNTWLTRLLEEKYNFGSQNLFWKPKLFFSSTRHMSQVFFAKKMHSIWSNMAATVQPMIYIRI